MDASRRRRLAHGLTLVGGVLMLLNLVAGLAYATLAGRGLGVFGMVLALAGPIGIVLALSPFLLTALVLYSVRSYGPDGRRGRRNGALAVVGALGSLVSGLVLLPVALVALVGGVLMITGPQPRAAVA